MRRILIVLASLAGANSAQSQDYPALSEGTAIVTGTRAETRAEGLSRALRDVLVKRSGDPALLRDLRKKRHRSAYIDAGVGNGSRVIFRHPGRLPGLSPGTPPLPAYISGAPGKLLHGFT